MVSDELCAIGCDGWSTCAGTVRHITHFACMDRATLGARWRPRDATGLAAASPALPCACAFGCAAAVGDATPSTLAVRRQPRLYGPLHGARDSVEPTAVVAADSAASRSTGPRKHPAAFVQPRSGRAP